MAKETKLDDSAGIYAKREKRTEREKMKDMTFKEKVNYFKMYYLKKVIVSVIIVGLLGSLLYQVLSPKSDKLLSIAVVNDYFDQDKLDVFLSDLNTHFDVNPDKEEISFDDGYYISDTDVSQNSYASIQKLTTYVYNKEIDVIITDETYFKSLTADGYLISLSDLLPTDLYMELADKYYTGAVLEEDDDGETSLGPEKPYGIYLDDSEIYKSTGSIIDKPVLGVITNSTNKDTAIELIKYLLELE